MDTEQQIKSEIGFEQVIERGCGIDVHKSIITKYKQMKTQENKEFSETEIREKVGIFELFDK